MDYLDDFTPLSTEFFWKMAGPMRFYFAPVYYGLENIKHGGPYLFVGNHTIYGVIDAFLCFAKLYRNKGIFVRGLGDNIHFKIPGWRNFLLNMGVIRASRANCAHFMQARENIVVYPGGGREVCRRKGEAYTLIWKERTGFVRMAIEHQYSILPFSSVGVEHAYSIIIDRNDIMNSLAGKIIKKIEPLYRACKNGEELPPIARGLGPTMFPRPEKFYYSFGQPIDTKPYAGYHDDHETLLSVRAKVADSIKSQINNLLEIRAKDQSSGILRRILTKYT